MEIRQMGYEVCASGHGYGPAVRDYYLIHFVDQGKGYFEYEQDKICVKQHQAFLILPHEVTYYEADQDNPWTYSWLGFSDGDSERIIKALGFCEDKRIITLSGHMAKRIQPALKSLSQKQIKTEGDRLYEKGRIQLLLSALVQNKDQYERLAHPYESETLYVEAAKIYMERRFMYPLTIQEVAEHVGVERSYLYRLFLAAEQMSPKDYLMQVRMTQAITLLKRSDLTVKAVAYSVGYQDPYLFSKMFKRYYGCAPSQLSTKFYD